MQVNHKESVAPSAALTRSCAMVIAVGAATAACASAPVRQDPTTTAATAEQTHCGKAFAEDPRIFAPEVRSGAAPVMRNYRMGKSDREVLAGAELTIAAEPGLTSEWITRNLICHQAHRVLGHGAQPQDDPFWLSGSWLAFEVRPRGDQFVVQIYAEDSESAQTVLARTRAFVAGRGGVSSHTAM